MKHLSTKALPLGLIAVCTGTMATVPVNAAIDPTFNPGDLILGIQSSAAGSTGTVLEVNVGASLLFKSPNQSFLVGNIGTELTSIFGASWWESPNLFFGLAMANNNINLEPGTADANGDFNSTIYVSRARTSNGTLGLSDSVAWGSPTALTSTQISNASTAMLQLAGTFDLLDSNGVATIPTSNVNDWKDLNPLVGTLQTAAFGNTFAGGIQFRFNTGEFSTSGDFGGLTDVEGVVDLYRVVRFADGGGTVGQGSYLGSFAIEQDGDIRYVAAVPEPGSATMLGFGLISLIGFCGRFRKQA